MAFLDTIRYLPLGIKLSKLVPSEVWEKRPSHFFSLCAFTIISSLLLGGGTRGGFLSDTILELLAIPAFLVSLSLLVTSPQTESKYRARWALILCLAIALVPLIQLVPLPPWIWIRLPHREEMAAVFDLLGHEPPWLPISVSPSSTWLSVLGLLPPFAIFLGVIQLNYGERRLLSLIVISVGTIGALVGLIQVAQGPSSPLRFFTVTSDIEAVGFFANRNHFAALMYTLLLFSAAWAIEATFALAPWKDRKNLESASIATLTASFLVPIIFIAADILTRSRAGLGLLLFAVFGACALLVMDRRRSFETTAVKLLFGSIMLALLLVVQFALYRAFDRFAVDPMEDGRIIFARNTIRAAKAYMPIGSGVGTFVSVYPTFEAPQDAIANIFANHAHNDWLEAWLEGGVASIVLVAAFVVWLVMRCEKIWWRAPAKVRAIDVSLARAATIAIALVMAHSFVDYPLRTDAMMAVFAFSCALVIEPLCLRQDEMEDRSNKARGRSEKTISRVAAPQVPTAAGGPAGTSVKPAQQPPGRWGEDIDWPDQWRK